LQFAPDTSTANRCMIGGMIGNNACGAYSIRHGTTRDHVIEIEAVLADGALVSFGPLDGPALEAKRRLPTLEGRIYRAVFEIIDAHRELILQRYPRPEVVRRNTGYALDVLARGRPWVADGPPFNLARLLCGSEGTLALVTAATLGLVPRASGRRPLRPHRHAHGRHARDARRGPTWAGRGRADRPAHLGRDPPPPRTTRQPVLDRGRPRGGLGARPPQGRHRDRRHGRPPSPICPSM